MGSTARILEEASWYHKIALGDGLITPGHDWEYLWDNIRAAKKDVCFAGKKVLDLGTMEGLWAFEAEQAGARQVVAVDMHSDAAEKFLYCRARLQSSVIPLFNVPIRDLHARTSDYHRFDIVQHLGLLYHVSDPLDTLLQCRQLIHEGGHLILETAAEGSMQEPYLIFNGVKGSDHETSGGQEYWWRMYDGGHPQWMPTIPCLKEMLLISGFVPLLETISIVQQPETRGINADDPNTRYARCRVALVARAVAQEAITCQVIQDIVGA